MRDFDECTLSLNGDDDVERERQTAMRRSRGDDRFELRRQQDWHERGELPGALGLVVEDDVGWCERCRRAGFAAHKREILWHGTVQPYGNYRTDTIPNYGPNRRPRDEVADFLLGGNRKRLIIERLAGDPITALELVEALGIGRSTVFEVIRALWGADALDDVGDGSYRLARRKPIGRALRRLVAALEANGGRVVDRPPRPRAG